MKRVILIFLVVALYSCGTNEKEGNITINTTYYESGEIYEQLKIENKEITELCVYARNGVMIDSLHRTKGKVSFKILNSDLFVGDTLKVKVYYNEPVFESQYVLLGDTVTKTNLLEYDDLISSNTIDNVELSFLCRVKGDNYFKGIIFDSSIEVIKHLSNKRFIGRRVGNFEQFEINFKVNQSIFHMPHFEILKQVSLSENRFEEHHSRS